MEIYLKDYLQYQSVKRWIRQLEKKATKIDPNAKIPFDTLEYVKSSLDHYTKFTGLNPDQLIEEARIQNRTVGDTLAINDRLDDFWKATPAKTVAGIEFSMIRAFYAHNGITLKVSTPGIPVIRQEEIIPTSEIIRRHCDAAPLQHSSWILTNNYLGLRVGALPLLTVEDFKVENWTRDLPLYPVRIRKELTGMPWELELYIGHDAMTKNRVYFEKKHFKVADQPWHFGVGYMIRMFKKYAYEAGIIGAPEGLDDAGAPKGLCVYHPHCLRKRRQTIQESADTNQNWVDYLMQHIPKGTNARNYSRPIDATPEELYQAQLKVLPQLEVYGHHEQSPTKSGVAIQKLAMLEMLKTISLDSEKKQQIENILKNVRLESEIKDAVTGL
jgi:hypothetical protein